MVSGMEENHYVRISNFYPFFYCFLGFKQILEISVYKELFKLFGENRENMLN